ncbi:MAG: methionyl-tRNA formyltransferase [Candidatus Yanofskybacteria bacterium RIFCSPHIGHO2_02_FULL_41_11]|uniref:Methionyl-tRNA formyltransferase n=1 Tax=Candidatus Yanofskybacteria bacterium RIFCSPHIGHO2_02_FULL_41_11 TaxID=1802675 RepID=A0A1F8F4W1_9BACT|nr:MAG: methionyl-tRNA formyltransferase [Candidatus Yanofskybacteria bacterium RIFCSPHIGHO2_02_FULL_41_11]
MKSQAQNIVFFGTSEFAVPTLEALINVKYEIAAVITRPDKPIGRKQALSPSPIKILARQKNIKVLQPITLKSDEFFESFKKFNPDICIVTAYGKIIPSQYIEIPKYGFLNIHPSLLPKYRGPSPIQTAILNGEKEMGVTIIMVDEEVDHGLLLSTIAYSLSSKAYYKEIEKELAELGAKLLIETLPKYIRGEIAPEPQDHSQATFTKILSRENGRINWNEPAEKICNQIRALNPEPGTWTTWNNKVINIPIFNVGYPQVEENKPGMVIKVNKDIFVATGKGYLKLETIQLEGGREMPVKSFVNGYKDFIGSALDT